MQIFQSATIVFLSLLLVVVYKEGVLGRIVSQIVGVGVAAMLSLYFLKKDNLFAFFIWNPRYVREALAFGIPLIPHVAGGFLLMSIDRLIINVELGLADAGIYAVAAQLSLVMILVFDAINKAYVPWLFEKLKLGRPEDKLQIVRYTYAWFGVIILGILLAFLIGKPIITIIAGDQYSSAGELVGWLALGQGFVGMYLMVTNYIFYSKRTGLLSLVTISSGLLNVFLLFTFLRIFSLKGAAIAFSTAMGFRFLCTWWVAQRQYPMPWFNFNTK
jgi:O-antigen/teichoic acid export membrane protein